MSAEVLETLSCWCGECNTEREFDQVPGGTGFEYACRHCSSAMFAGELPMIEAILQPAVTVRPVSEATDPTRPHGVRNRPPRSPRRR